MRGHIVVLVDHSLQLRNGRYMATRLGIGYSSGRNAEETSIFSLLQALLADRCPL